MRDVWVRRIGVLLAGGALGLYFPLEVRPWGWAIIGLILLRILIWRPKDFWGKIFRPELILCSLTFTLGLFYGEQALSTLPPPVEIKGMAIEATLLDWVVTPEEGRGVIRFERGNWTETEQPNMDFQPEGRKYRLLVFPDRDGRWSETWLSIRPGDLIAFAGNLEQPKEPGTPGALNQPLYNAVRSLNGTVTAKGDARILEEGIPSFLWQVRRQVTQQLEGWDSEAAGVMEGILFGDSARIPDQTQEQYRITGVLHVFAASGSNVAFVLVLAWGLTGLLPLPLRVWISVGFLILYIGLCGGSVTVLRAGVMGTAVLLGRLWQGAVSPLRWLFFAAAALFVWQPLVLMDLSFQLSFAAAWGIVVLAPYLADRSWMRRLSLLLSPLSITLGAQIVTAPLLVSAFYRFSLVGLFANLLILGILGGVLQLGLIGTFFSFFPPTADPLFQAGIWLIELVNAVLSGLAALPWADVWVVQPGWGVWVLWYAGIILSLIGWEKADFMLAVMWRKVTGRVKLPPIRILGAGLLLIVFIMSSPLTRSGELRISMLDVGQGDALLIETPKKQAILVDTGPATEQYDAGERVVIPYLLEQGVNKLSALLITHEDMDHIGGAAGILLNIPVGWIGVPQVGERLANEDWEQGLPRSLRPAQGLVTLGRGDVIELDSGVRIEVLAPGEILEGTRSDSNNNSLVLKLNYLGQSLLLTGDMEEEEMEEIMSSGQDFAADIFKVPHHGSRFSQLPEWLDLIQPQAVLISVGKNSFGHPAPQVLDYWQGRSTPIYRTDQQGTVVITISRQGAEIMTGR